MVSVEINVQWFLTMEVVLFDTLDWENEQNTIDNGSRKYWYNAAYDNKKLLCICIK